MKIVDSRKSALCVCGNALVRGQVYRNVSSGSLVLAMGENEAVYLHNSTNECAGYALVPASSAVWERVEVEIHIV